MNFKQICAGVWLAILAIATSNSNALAQVAPTLSGLQRQAVAIASRA
jgi:hypothetical protein